MRDKILVEATRLIAAAGFEATSLQTVADAVGVKKPSVLYHFPSKDDLRKAVLERLLARWNEVLPRLLRASALSGLAKFEAVTGEAFEFFVEDPDRARIILRELLEGPGLDEAADRYIRPWVEVVSSYIRLGQESGQIQPDVDPEAYVLHVAMMSLSTIATSDSMARALAAPSAKKKNGDATSGNGASKRTAVQRTTKHNGAHRATTDRIVRELVRMAERSLFLPSYLEHQRSKRAGAKPTRRGAD